MKKSSWWKNAYLCDTLCAARDKGMSWLLEVKTAGIGVVNLFQPMSVPKGKPRRRSVFPGFERLETRAMPSTFTNGDLFIGIGGGLIQWRHSDGTLVQTLNTGVSTSDTTGMAIDSSNELYSTLFQASEIKRFDNTGTPLTGTFGSGFIRPESMVFDLGGNAYVGDSSSDGFGHSTIRKFNSSGTLLASYTVNIENVGADWIDLAADQQTIFYTSEGTKIKRFDVGTNTQLSDFATSLPGTAAFALRILPDGGLLVADTDRVLRLDASGSIIKTYTISGTTTLYGLTLDSDGTSFWTGDYSSGGDVYKVDIDTGNLLETITMGTSIPEGLVVFGKPATYPVNEPTVPVGEVDVGLNYGSLRLSHPLDFDLSPGTDVGGNPALDYNSNTAAPLPVVKVPFTSDANQSLPSSITAQLTWDFGTPQTAVTFNSFTGISAGDTMVLAVPVTSTISSSGNDNWTMTVTAQYSGHQVIENLSGQMPIVLNQGPLGNGWGIDGIDQLIAVSGGVILLHGNGDYAFFATTSTAGVYTTPPNDFGTLSGTSSLTYTTPDQTVERFNSSHLLTSVTDRDGVSMTYSYTGSELTRAVAPDGGTTTLNYSGGVLASIVEPGGRTLTIGESGGNLTHITDVDSTTRSFTYGTSSLLQTDQWAPYNATFTYGAENNVTNVNRGLGTTYAVAAAVTIGLASSPAPYAKQGNATITDALTHATTYSLDWLGQETGVTAANGAAQTWALNGAGLATLSIDALNSTTSYSYDSSGDLLTENRPDGSSTSYAYDGTYHQVTQIIDSEASGVNETTTMYLNTTGDVTKSVDPVGNTTTFAWSAGLMTSMTDPNGLQTTYGYDSHRRLTALTDPLTNLTSYTFDSNGNPATTIDPRLKTTTTQYDGRNRLTQEVTPDGDNASFDTTINRYDASGHLTFTEDARLFSSTFGYDQRGWETQVIEAAGQTDARTTSKAYDVAGNATLVTDPDNLATTYAYDTVNRPTLTTDSDGFTTQTRYDLNDNVTATVDSRNLTSTTQFDTLNRATAVADPLGNTDKTSFDLAGNVTKTVDGNNNTTSMGFDTDNRLTATTDPNGNITKSYFDKDGNVTLSVDGRGLTSTLSYHGQRA